MNGIGKEAVGIIEVLRLFEDINYSASPFPPFPHWDGF